MKQFKLLLGLMLLTLLVFSCKDDEPTPEEMVSGTYTLTSIATDKEVDPEEDGTFGDTDLTDNISCPSRLILDATNGLTWERLYINQFTLHADDLLVEYGEITCEAFSETGSFAETDNSIVLTTDSSGPSTYVFNVINNNELEYTYAWSFVVEGNGVLETDQVTLTLKYTK